MVAYASPLKLFEYLALGRAIVAPDQPNIREILDDGVNAVLFDPADPDGLTRAIERLSHDDALRERVAEGARRTIAERGLTWDRNAERVTTLFNELLAARAGRADVSVRETGRLAEARAGIRGDARGEARIEGRLDAQRETSPGDASDVRKIA